MSTAKTPEDFDFAHATWWLDNGMVKNAKTLLDICVGVSGHSDTASQGVNHAIVKGLMKLT